ncbi:DNA-binding response regulator [Geothermobacter hydrogeniphilus]|uniref:DNA-binding response regulator n=1 Tax=Geothermobacter hydrogeniphilus TaxID=1969733 RepID=A0A2K2H6X2_9BACT|nr:response regulator transcription factor [Geothermobacter hydrogeniphilus]PNU19048.1 DNA-binding response regulator [Geothermobacter hydrogeniphilus]
MTTRLIVADDHVIFRQGLVSLLTAEEGFDILGVADNGRDALDLIRAKRPDIAILDISMPGQGAIEISEIVANTTLPTKVIALTMHRDALIVNGAVAAGVAGYVLKDNAFADLIYAIRAVTAGGTFISPSITGNALGIKNSAAGQLTRREREVLKLITGGQSNRQIAASLFISIKTVETHRSRLMRKLELHNTADLVRYALQNGLA